MKFSVTSYNAVAVWKWDTHPSSSDQHKLYHYAKPPTAADGDDYGYGDEDDDEDDDDEEDDVCGICRLAFESTCPECKIPGDDCPLIWGECTHVFHMHCLLKWIDTESSKGQCPMDRRPWETMDRAPDKLPTTTSGAPVATVVPGPIPNANTSTDETMGETRHVTIVEPPPAEGDAPTPRSVEVWEEEDEGMEVDDDDDGDGDDGDDGDEAGADLHPASLRV